MTNHSSLDLGEALSLGRLPRGRLCYSLQHLRQSGLGKFFHDTLLCRGEGFFKYGIQTGPSPVGGGGCVKQRIAFHCPVNVGKRNFLCRLRQTRSTSWPFLTEDQFCSLQRRQYPANDDRIGLQMFCEVS